MTSRRGFLGGLMATAGLAATAKAEEGGASLPAMGAPGERRLRIGVLSDIHVKLDEPHGGEVLWGAGIKEFKESLEFMRGEGVDVVAICGDMADTGRIEQLQLVADAWQEVFPGNKLPDGRPVEKFFVYGNHDSSNLKHGIAVRNLDRAKKVYGSEEEGKKHLIPYHEKEAMAQCFGEDAWEPIYAKTIGGYVFVGCNWNYERKVAAWFDENADRLGLKGDKPFFYFQHPHPTGTCNSAHGGFAWGHDWNATTPTLSKYHNCVAFSGHSHYSLGDETSIWQGEFTSINAATTSYVGWRSGRDNGGWEAHGRKGRMIGPVPAAKRLIMVKGHGMVVDVYDDRIVIARHGFVKSGKLGPDWVLPLPACVDEASRPYSFEAAESRSSAPQFREGAEKGIKITMRKDKNRAGKECDMVAVEFPEARSEGPLGRVFEYEVTAENVAYGIVRIANQKRINSAYQAYPIEYEAEGDRTECLFMLDELPKEASVKFRIRPLNCFGVAGRDILSEKVKLPLE